MMNTQINKYLYVELQQLVSYYIDTVLNALKTYN